METPYVLIGTTDRIAEVLQARRERFGISYVVVNGDVMEDFAPVMAQLAGT